MSGFHFSPEKYHEYLAGITDKAFTFSESTELQDWKIKLSNKVSELLGGIPQGDKSPDINCIREWWNSLGLIKKIVIRSEPFSDMPVYVCLPENTSPPYTWMICLQGHTTGMHNSIAVSKKDEKIEETPPLDRDFAVQCMRNGIAAIAVEQRAFGERSESEPQDPISESCRQPALRSLLLGHTLMGERIYDVRQCINYLLYRKDVKKIGIMGNSGGGAVSMYAAALIKEIQFAVIGSYFCTFKDSIFNIRHCIDNYIPGIMKWADMSDILGLFAPKPVLITSGEKDGIFPVTGVKKAFKNLKRIYKFSGMANNCHLIIHKYGHRFLAEKAWPCILRIIDKA
jgi:dienelactone hydrolase